MKKIMGALLVILTGFFFFIAMSITLVAPPTPSGPEPGRCGPGTGSAEGGEGSNMPDEARPWMEEASKTSGIPVEWLAAVARQESDFRPNLFADDINGGTWGLFQINAEEWSKVTGGGTFSNPDIKDPMVHAKFGGKYFKQRLATVKKMQKDNPDQAYAKIPATDALVIAHNAGEGNLPNYPNNLPSITEKYLQNVRRNAGKVTTGDPVPCPPKPQGGGAPGNAPKPDDPGEYKNLVAGKEGGVDPWNFYWGQCTSYVAWAVRTYSPHKDFNNQYKVSKWGNAKEWRGAAQQAGLKVDQTPVVGSVAVRQSGRAGHVAFVVKINDDDTFVINEYNHVITEGFSTRTVRMGEDFDDIIHFEIPPKE